MTLRAARWRSSTERRSWSTTVADSLLVNRTSHPHSKFGGLRRWLATAALVAAAGGLGLGLGYLQWGSTRDWYEPRDISGLPPLPEDDLVRYGWQLVADTAAHIGRSAIDPGLRYAGNDLACTHC